MTDPAYTDSMNRLIGEFARLPGIGRRTAERLAFHVLKADPEEALGLARAIEDVKTNVRHCSTCFNLTEHDPCPICAAAEAGRRNPRRILVVEQPRDLVTLEQTGVYDGVYHVLLGRIAPLEGVGPEDLTLDALVERARQLGQSGEEPVEVILGTNPNVEGDGTALHVADALRVVPNVRVTRLARGLPTGSQLEYANKSVLSDAITSRQSLGEA
jgi:recombination protein RecR